MKIREKIENVFNAVTFAEANEHETARQFINAGKKVLLAGRPGAIRQKTIDYAINVCSRIDAELHLLIVGSSDFRSDLIRTQALDSGVKMNVSVTQGDLTRAVTEHTRHDSRTVFVVLDSSEAIVPQQKSGVKSSSSDWGRIGCPLVVVSDGSTI
ncbi:MAG: hypothetical protein LLF86_09295 [Nitrospiraceae bacterium]|nr:hypothetical protein [Nitrospiraceae bacterium]